MKTLYEDKKWREELYKLSKISHKLHSEVFDLRAKHKKVPIYKLITLKNIDLKIDNLRIRAKDHYLFMTRQIDLLNVMIKIRAWKANRCNMSQYNHIPKPVTPGTVYPHQSGWIFTVVGNDLNDYYCKAVTYDSPVIAKVAMRQMVRDLNLGELR